MAADHESNTMEFNLANILNILWRRRIFVLGLPALGLVVGLLYGVLGTKRWSAEATIRPGITSFSPEGGPFRQWQLKDITTWYDKLMFRQELNRRLGLPAKFRTVIKAEFIATGLTNLAGGEVISLWTTGTSPELAAAIIDTSIALFKEYAEADTISSQLKLTKDGLKLQVDMLENRLNTIDMYEAGVDLELKAARAESLVVSVLDRELGVELEKKKKEQGFYQNRIESLAASRPVLEEQLNQIDNALKAVANDSSTPPDPATIPAWARRDAVLDGGDVMGGLTEIRFRLQQQLDRNQAQQDSFAYVKELSILDFAKMSISREATVQSRLREIESKIGGLELEKDYELPVKRQEIRNDVRSRLTQLGTLSSLQRVGQTLVSEKPVRPRPLRAILILVFLGLLGGLVLAFVWDYVMANRQEIFRS